MNFSVPLSAGSGSNATGFQRTAASDRAASPPLLRRLVAAGISAAVVCCGSIVAASEPAESPSPAPRASAAERYLGAFRVPRGDGSGRKGKKNEYSYSYGGDIAAADDKTLWISTHTHHQLVGRIAIPEPARPSTPTAFKELPIAKPVDDAVDVTGGLRAPSVQTSGKAMILGDILPGKGRLHWVFHHHYNVKQTKYRVLGAFDTQKQIADGPFGLIDANRKPIRSQLSGRYLARVPKEWVEMVGGSLVCGGGGLPGQGSTGAGPSLFGFTPPEPGADPHTTFAKTRELLLYPFDKDRPKASRRSLPGWNLACRPYDVAWIGDTIVFVACLARGPVWYGAPEGPDGLVDRFIPHKTFHAEKYELNFLFYNAKDLAAVAGGQRQPWEPKPYAEAPVPHLMGGNLGRVQTLPVALSWDPQTGRLYLIQNRVDGSRGRYAHQPIVHVFDLHRDRSIRDWAAALSVP